jgi:nucleoside-diphosphate-sugar epimerase
MITVLGASGFIGTHLVDYLQRNEYPYYAPEKGDETLFTKPLGHVIYAIGMTADFREWPMESVEAHVCILLKLIQEGNFDSLTYLSSTRVYGEGQHTSESSALSVVPDRLDDIYNISKLMGESTVLHSGRPNMKVARLSNVLGEKQNPDTFLAQLLDEGSKTGVVTFQTALDSAKDYIYIEDVTLYLKKIAEFEGSGIYNIASGELTSNRQIADCLAERLGVAIAVTNNAPLRLSQKISIKKTVEAFGFKPRRFSEFFPNLLYHYHKDSHVS